MEQEVLQAILAALEAQKAEIAALRAELDSQGGGLGEIKEAIKRAQDEAEYGGFCDRHGEKFAPVAEKLKVLIGGDFDPMRETFESAREASSGEGYNEDEYVDGILADVIQRLDSLKETVPEAAPVIDAAEEAVQDVAVVNDDVSGVPDPQAEEAEEDEPELWSEEMLKNEKPEGVKLYA
jgi:hypothetical protein